MCKEHFAIVSSYFYKEEYERVIKRGTCTNKYNRLACEVCLNRIKFKATSHRLFKRITGTDKQVNVIDTEHFVRVIYVYCSECDSVPPTPIPGAMVYDDQLIAVPDWSGGESNAL